MSIRQKRLENDYRSLQKICAFNEIVNVKILEKSGQPPEYYRIKISNCKGVESVINNTPKYRTEHTIVIKDFPFNYPDPGVLPTVRIETPIFHPNVYEHGMVCFGGNELNTLNQPLNALVKRVISMIQYEILRFGMPANSAAKAWAERNKHLFPLSTASDGGQSKPKLIWR